MHPLENEEEEEAEAEDDVDAADAALEGWDGQPFITEDDKLYGQDYDAIKAGFHIGAF